MVNTEADKPESKAEAKPESEPESKDSSKPESKDDLKSVTMPELQKKLGSSPDGLSQAEAQKRLTQYGPNEIAEKKTNPFLKFLTYFWGPIPWMIEGAVILSGIVRHWLDFGIILIQMCIRDRMGPVLFGLATYYGHWSFNPPTGLLLAISEIITLGVSTALAAGVFLIVGLMTKRR